MSLTANDLEGVLKAELARPSGPLDPGSMGAAIAALQPVGARRLSMSG